MNVLVITTDQQRADTLGCYGSRLGITPTLDALARAGTRFDLALCQHPYCQPSRWSILTGQHPRRHGVWTNGIDPTDAQQRHALSARLSREGYRTAFVGKAHFATNGVLFPGRSEHVEAIANARRMDPEWHGPYMGFEHAELVQLGHFPMGYGPHALHYGRFLAREGRLAGLKNLLLASPFGASFPTVRAPQTWFSRLPEALHPTSWIADRAVAWLERASPEPFFLWVSFPDPHHPLDPPQSWSGRVLPADVSLPTRNPQELRGKPPWQGRFSRGLFPVELPLNTAAARLSDAQLASMSAAYHSLVAMLDRHIGRILSALDRTGRAGDTLVVFTTDHGELLGDHGLIFKGPFHYDGLVRVPLLVKGPGVPAASAVGQPVSHIDLRPTVEAFLGLAPAAEVPVDGRSLWPVLDGTQTRHAAFCENDHRIGFREHVQTVVTAEFKLNRHVGRGYGELYFRGEDPGEFVNRWDDPACRETRAALEAELDVGLPPWTSPRRRPVSFFPA